ncbi:hypothetical protein ABTE36_23645, partial [Acinetobacter baumannii]
MGMIAAERVFKVLDNEDVLKNENRKLKIGNIKGAIDFENVSFAYNEPNYVLKNISFNIKAGET